MRGRIHTPCETAQSARQSIAIKPLQALERNSDRPRDTAPVHAQCQIASKPQVSAVDLNGKSTADRSTPPA